MKASTPTLCYLETKQKQTARMHVKCSNGVWEWFKYSETVLTMREYSTRMMLQSRMEGDTGGIFSILPFQVSVLPEDRDCPLKLATSCLTSFIFPLA